ncbi:MAG: helix-turn-helix domain-containing protein [Paracoccaceae bacterium]|nr:helix-turn-helix domain-containing protein [Paracoccaceae bacterium]MDG1371565.1 helix-turn-helix domain-containing protein [Paracoccaceae bacterium]
MSTLVDDGSTALAAMNADDVRSLIAGASDLAVLLGPERTVVNIFGAPEIKEKLGTSRWIAKSLDEVMDPAAANKLIKLESIGRGTGRVSHVTKDGERLEFVYSPVHLVSSDCTLLVGRDETRVAALQDRLLEQHRTAGERLESQKHSEAQYRKLFAIGAEPVLVIAGDTGKIIDMNSSAADLLDVDANAKIGRQFSTLVHGSDKTKLRAFFATALATNATETATLKLSSNADITIRATHGPGASSTLLLQLNIAAEDADTTDDSQKGILDLIRIAGEAAVIVDETGVIVWANMAFAEIVTLGQDRDVIGLNLEVYLDAKDIDLNVVLANLQRHGEIKQLPSSMRNEAGERLEVELSAVTITNSGGANFGFFIRRMPGLPTPPDLMKNGEVALDALWGQLGKAPLRELVNEEIAGVEKNLIRAALDLNKGNRSATARLLGLSRQSLYSKLERYGISCD